MSQQIFVWCVDVFLLDLLILWCKKFLDYTNLLLPKECEKNDKMVLKDSQWKETKKIVFLNIFQKRNDKKVYSITFNKYRKLKNLKISYIFKNFFSKKVFSVICNKCDSKDKKKLKKN